MEESCTASEHTYVHAQHLLTTLAALPGGESFRWAALVMDGCHCGGLGPGGWALPAACRQHTPC